MCGKYIKLGRLIHPDSFQFDINNKKVCTVIINLLQLLLRHRCARDGKFAICKEEKGNEIQKLLKCRERET
jgi:hypothetical protein